MPTKERVVITGRYTGKKENVEMIYDLIRSVRLKSGQISVIVQNDLSLSIVANKNLSVEEINEIICMQYNVILKEIERVRRKKIGKV